MPPCQKPKKMKNSLKISKQYRRSFTRQKDHSDCGIACLCSIIKYHGHRANAEALRIASGTTQQGTTMLGMYQAASSIGFEAEGMQGNVDYIKSLSNPAILHIISQKTMLHYVVCYKYANGKFLIGDPAQGLQWLSEAELLGVWQSQKLLALHPAEGANSQQHTLERPWPWLWSLLRDDMGALTTALLLGIAMATLGLATAVFAQAFIDTLIPSGDKVRIYASIALLIGILLTRLALAFRRQHLMLQQGYSINNRIVGSFLSSLMLLPKPFFDSRHTGDMVARLNDVGRIQQTVSFVFGELLINALMAVAALVAIWAYSPTIGLVLLGCVPLYAAVAALHHSRIMQQQQGVMSAYALNQSNYISTMHNIEPIKALGREELFARTAMQIFRDLQGKMLNLGRLGVLVQIRAELVGLLAIALVVLLSAHQMLSSDMTAGTFMAVFSLSGTLLPAVAGIAFANVQTQGARVAFERMYEFASMEKETTQTTETSVPIEFEELKIENVDFRYAGRRQLLKGLSLSVQRGQMVALWGDNGSGKSTIMGLLQRFYMPEGGRISLNGTDIGQLPLQHYRSLLGVVPQHVGLLNAPLLANIVMDDGPEVAERALRLMTELGLAAHFERFPQGYLTMLGEGGVPISGGQRQLVGLARALVRKPQLLLIDEPTAHIDSPTEAFVLRLLLALHERMGILCITHSPTVAAHADRIAVLVDGRIAAEGSHQQLMQSDNAYSAAWRELMGISARG